MKEEQWLRNELIEYLKEQNQSVDEKETTDLLCLRAALLGYSFKYTVYDPPLDQFIPTLKEFILFDIIVSLREKVGI